MKARTDLALVMGLALAACLFAALLPPSLAAVRAPLALPLILALPGYALVSAMFPPHTLRTAEVVTLSIAFSIAAAIVSGLLLDLLGVALKAAPWMGVLTALTLAAAAWASARGHARPLAFRPVRLRGAEAGALAVALSLLVGAATLGFTPLAPPKRTQGTAALWLVPAPGGSHAACIGVINEQLHVTSYSVTVSVAGTLPRSFGPITLAPGASWTRVIAVASGRPAINASLSTTADPFVTYRSAVLRDWNVAVSSC